jgi:opacity protein-like surface antigen
VLFAVALPLSALAQPQPAAAPAATDFQLSPLHEQNDVQQWFDRHECDGQAKRQSGYDPDVEYASGQAAGEEYLRAMAACLGERGYQVRYAPPALPSPPSPIYQLRPEQPRVRELRYRALSVEAGGGYTVPTGSTADYVNGGANAGAALDWFPSAAVPIGLRLGGSYTWLKPASQLLALNNAGYNRGQQDLYGGDVDLRLNLSRPPSRQQLYLMAGVGWYRTDTLLQNVSAERICGVRYCDLFGTVLAQEHDTSAWESSWNAGLGWEIALDTHTVFFVEARYRHIHSHSGESQFVPMSLGLRF